MTNIIKNGQIIRQSRNLRGMLDYARVSPVVRIESAQDGPARGRMTVHYSDGATSLAEFASYGIMIDFIRQRRAWRNAEHFRQGPDVGYTTKPGTLVGGPGMEPCTSDYMGHTVTLYRPSPAV